MDRTGPTTRTSIPIRGSSRHSSKDNATVTAKVASVLRTALAIVPAILFDFPVMVLLLSRASALE